MAKLLITIEGRHLRQLGELIGTGLVRWVQETDDRKVDVPEDQPSIESIVIERMSSK